MTVDMKAIHEEISAKSVFVEELRAEIGKVIVGQRDVIDRMLIGLFGNGHLLIEGVPGLAKTLTIKTLATALQLKFQRIQFTPDLLPADLTGTLVYNPKDTSFSVKKGPIFANIILADEINRAPAKVQSALLEAMQEHQVTIGEQTFVLEPPFLVLATQNPIEQEGTYPLPEAQLDRFMLKVRISYPDRQEERQILDRMTTGESFPVKKVLSPKDITAVQALIHKVYVDDKIKEYVLDLVQATRDPQKFSLDDLKPLIAYGASPRATIYLIQAAKAHAFLNRRGYVSPEDIKAIGPDVLRHRVIPTYEAEAQELSTDDLIKTIFDSIEVP